EKVVLVHRRDSLRAEKILQDRLLKHDKIEVLWNREVEEIIGDDNPKGVTGMRLASTSGDDTIDVPIDGFFVAIGHAPATDLFQGQVEMKDSGYIITAPDSTATSVPGVYAAGDVTDETYRQAVTAAGMGCMAALEAEKYLAAMEAGEAQAAE
ncbi:MAG: FAD-dependent oxidoreductase, partial [Pseudomonadota bacterium]